MNCIKFYYSNYLPPLTYTIFTLYKENLFKTILRVKTPWCANSSSHCSKLKHRIHPHCGISQHQTRFRKKLKNKKHCRKLAATVEMVLNVP